MFVQIVSILGKFENDFLVSIFLNKFLSQFKSY